MEPQNLVAELETQMHSVKRMDAISDEERNPRDITPDSSGYGGIRFPVVRRRQGMPCLYQFPI